MAECKKVWKVFCKLRAGESAEVAATAKQVAARARQQRWRETELLRAGTRESKRAKAAADKERARRLREELDPTRPDRPKGWSRRVPDRAVLQWGAKRDFIRRRPTSCGGGEGSERGSRPPHALAEEAQTPEGTPSCRCEGPAGGFWSQAI